jgi:hypothetical protein
MARGSLARRPLQLKLTEVTVFNMEQSRRTGNIRTPEELQRHHLAAIASNWIPLHHRRDFDPQFFELDVVSPA